MSGTWEWVDGYDNSTYEDSMIFEVDSTTKVIQQITDQTMVSGENKSQFIRFEMDRYYDGVDLSTKNIQIIYLANGGYSDINAAVCVERCDDRIRFGWVVPGNASYDVGTTSFSIEFVGDEYVLKTRVYDLEVFDGLNGGEVIPEPEEKVWYIELQQRCDFVLNQATAAKDAASQSATAAAASASGAASIKTETEAIKAAVDETADELSDATDQIATNKRDIAAANARIDQALTDYEGSEESEIMDARVGRDGTTYSSLGAAIRGQFDQLRLYIDSEGYVCQADLI